MMAIMVPTSKASPATVRAAAIVVGVIAILFLPVGEIGSGFLLGYLHPGLGQIFVFSGRWALDSACVAAAGLSLLAWLSASRRVGLAACFLLLAVALPFIGRAWLLHVDSIVSYPPGYFSE
jgi:hypothetical protein